MGSFSLIVCFLIFILLVVLSVTVYTLCYYHRHIQQPLESFIRHVDEYALAAKPQGGLAFKS